MPEDIDDILQEIERQKIAARKAKATRAGAGRPKGRKNRPKPKKARPKRIKVAELDMPVGSRASQIRAARVRAAAHAREAKAGRPKAEPETGPVESIALRYLDESGIMPKDLMLAWMRELWDDGRASFENKARAAVVAKDAAPYFHPRLNAVNHSGNVTNSLDGFSSAELSILHQHLIALEAEGVDGAHDQNEGEEGLRGVADPFLEDGVA